MFSRGYGVEIEAIAPLNMTRMQLAAMISATGVPCTAENYNHQRQSHWKIVTDASLASNAGMEIVSPPLNGEAGFRQIETVCAVLHEVGMRINRNCGLHVHVEARDILLPAMKRLMLLYAESEMIIDAILPPSRRGSGNYYAKSLAVANYMEKIATARDLTALSQVFYGGDRHVKVNLSAFWRHGTVEFRQHSGTVDAGKITKWALACMRMVETAISEPDAVSVQTTQAVARAARNIRAGSKSAIVYQMLTRPNGCTHSEVLAATGWAKASVAGMAHTMGLEVRKEREGARGHREYRYFASLPRAAAVTTVVSNRPKIVSLDDFTARLKMEADEQLFWKQRAALFAMPTVAVHLAAERN